MEYTPITSFRRAMDAAQMQHLERHAQYRSRKAVNKWAALRELSAARAEFDLSDRDLTVLQALLSFHPGDELADPARLVVFPSNATICERLHDMPCSTMRRHLANLVRAGIILRRDSPNGKRYVRRGPNGPRAFGFDLSPLLHGFDDISAAAERARTEAAHCAALRESISLMRRDLIGLIDYAASLDADHPLNAFRDMIALVSRAMRRKNDRDDLEQITERLRDAVAALHAILDTQSIAAETAQMSTNDAVNEQHHQRSNKESFESDLTEKSPEADPTDKVPLDLVLKACPDILIYSEDPIRHWNDFTRLAHKVRPMLGICASVWNEALAAMGINEASVTVAAILQRFTEIRSPAAYLRSLAAKASANRFSSSPMIMSLMRQAA